MKCGERQEEASLLVDGELGVPEQVELLRHLADCADCRTFFDSLMRVRQVARTEQVAFPPALDEAVFAEALSRRAAYRGGGVGRGVERRLGGFWKRRLALGAPLAAALAAMLLVIGMGVGSLLFRHPAGAPADWRAYLTGAKTAGAPAPKVPAGTPTGAPTVIVIYGMPEIEVRGTMPVNLNGSPGGDDARAF